jgi:hypothetical protein
MLRLIFDLFDLDGVPRTCISERFVRFSQLVRVAVVSCCQYKRLFGCPPIRGRRFVMEGIGAGYESRFRFWTSCCMSTTREPPDMVSAVYSLLAIQSQLRAIACVLAFPVIFFCFVFLHAAPGRRCLARVERACHLYSRAHEGRHGLTSPARRIQRFILFRTSLLGARYGEEGHVASNQTWSCLVGQYRTEILKKSCGQLMQPANVI